MNALALCGTDVISFTTFLISAVIATYTCNAVLLLHTDILGYYIRMCRYEIMKSCWIFAPEDRITFRLLVKELNQQHPLESNTTNTIG